MDKRLFIGNLSYQATDQDLLDLFSQAGTVVSAQIIMDRETNRSKGFAFVEMGTADEAKKAIEMFNEKELLDRRMIVNVAKPREERTDRGFGGRDNRGGGYGGGRNSNRGGGGFQRGARKSY